ncbi:MerR family transcriptional regulator [Winogradskyella sp. DF17]|uniref:MerR family transcriptional regulator n=1 Tax=Winogradskyella pelagia TaxID=2819984 RepID=A0ABS3T3I5_9FLAO|nr:chaperone modulator CbpM [Winogradskyella sp. DF17]MBO3117300.1 MerR family transcriptional regulator [Winogradskyella sp. DF17]
MNQENLVSLPVLCHHYKMEMSFFNDLNDYGLIEIYALEETYYVHKERIVDIEKIIRLHQELNLNLEGIDTVFNLLRRIENLTSEINSLKNRLHRFEGDQ